MLFSPAMLVFEIIIILNRVVTVYLLKMFCANAARTLQRKDNYSMVSVSVENSSRVLILFRITNRQVYF